MFARERFYKCFPSLLHVVHFTETCDEIAHATSPLHAIFRRMNLTLLLSVVNLVSL